MRVKRTANELHRVKITVGKHLGHVLSFVGTNTMLTRNRPTDIKTVSQDLGCNILSQISLALDPIVITNERVKVAIAGMKHIPNFQS